MWAHVAPSAACSRAWFRCGALRALLRQIPERPIPWEFVDLIETDPARRVKLKISHERLARLHPADIADIVEDLAPDEREAVFETLDEEVAAEALGRSRSQGTEGDRRVARFRPRRRHCRRDGSGRRRRPAGRPARGDFRGHPAGNGPAGTARNARTSRAQGEHRRRPHEHRISGVARERHGSRRGRSFTPL